MSLVSKQYKRIASCWALAPLNIGTVFYLRHISLVALLLGVVVNLGLGQFGA